MKENKYDEAEFFARYSGMDRSVKGLAGAGEWHELKKLLPDFAEKRVLDLGCGFGWHCRYAVEHGAVSALGIDLSQRMIEGARERNALPQIEYRVMAIEDYDFPAGAFDVVISSLAFHYLESFGDICEKVFRTLTPGGVFVFSVEHPVFTAYGTEEWYRGPDGENLHWPVDRYFAEGRRIADFLGEYVVKYHRTVTTYVGDLLRTGFVVTGVVEPQPALELLDTVPGMRDELRRPMMLIVAAQKGQKEKGESISKKGRA